MFRRRRTPSPPPSELSAALGPEPEPDEDRPAPSRVQVIDDESFFDATAGGVSVVDFSASWCAPCRTFGPIFEEVARHHEGPVRFGSCDVDASPNTSALLQIRSVPTVVAFGPDGSELTRISGAVPRRQLEALINEVVKGTGAPR
jgi:thioredoxin 1